MYIELSVLIGAIVLLFLPALWLLHWYVGRTSVCCPKCERSFRVNESHGGYK